MAFRFSPKGALNSVFLTNDLCSRGQTGWFLDVGLGERKWYTPVWDHATLLQEIQINLSSDKYTQTSYVFLADRGGLVGLEYDTEISRLLLFIHLYGKEGDGYQPIIKERRVGGGMLQR